jgi:hypothetical protein
MIFVLFIGAVMAGDLIQDEWILDFRMESEGLFDESRVTVIKNLEDTVMITIVVYQGKIIVEKRVKNKSLLTGQPHGWTASELAYTGFHSGAYTVTHQEIKGR